MRQRSTSSGTATSTPTRTGPRKRGMIVKRKADVSGSMIIRSTKFTVIINLSYLNCDSRISATTIPSESKAAIEGRRSTASQKKFNSAQVTRNVALVARSSSVAVITTSALRCRSVMMTSAKASRREIASAGAKTAEQCGRNGQHGQDGPARLRSSRFPQRTARRHKTVIKRSLQGVGSPPARFFRC